MATERSASASGDRSPRARTDDPPGGAVHDMYASLRRGYARYQVAIAATAFVRRMVDRRNDRSARRDLAIALLAAEAAASVLASRDHRVDEQVAAWWDAAASAAASLAGLTAGTPPVAIGVWSPSSRETSAMAQWASAGASLVGRGGASRAARVLVVAAPYVLWPHGRRSLRQARLLPEAAVALGVFAVSGQLLVGVLRATAADVDRRSAQVVAERGEVATLEHEAVLRNVVIAETAARLRQVRDALGVDRTAAAAQAREEEARLRGWLAEQDAAGAPDSAGTVMAAPPAGAAPRLARFLSVSESLLRVGAAAQLVFEVVAQRRPSTAKVVAGVAAAHASWSCRRLLAAGPPAPRGPMVAADLGVLALCASLEAVESRRGWEPGWSRGYSEAMFAATGGVRGDRGLAALAVAGVGAVSGLGSLAVHDGGHRRGIRAAERSASAAVSAALGHWFAGLVTDLGDRLAATTDQLAAVRESAAAAEVRRNGQYFLHDSALQVLLWVQKPDLSDEQLLAWLDREVDRLDTAALGTARTPGLAAGLQDMTRGFHLLGLRAHTELTGDPYGVPTDVSACALDVCNEGLANVLRHSADRSPTVRLDVGPDELTLEVSNLLDRPDAPAPTPGTGTRSMIDRAAAVGGRVEVRHTAGTFRVLARLPLARRGTASPTPFSRPPTP